MAEKTIVEYGKGDAAKIISELWNTIRETLIKLHGD